MNDFYKCENCGATVALENAKCIVDRNAGNYKTYLCTECGSENLSEAELCENCGESFFADEREVYDGLCKACITDLFNHDAAFRHICRCRYCAADFTLRLTDMDDVVAVPSDKMIGVTLDYANRIRTKYYYASPLEKPRVFNEIEKLIKDVCIGKDSDLDHYVIRVLHEKRWKGK